MEPLALLLPIIVLTIMFSSILPPSLGSLQCHNGLVKSSLSDTSHFVVTEDPQEARASALCHVLCINYLESINGTTTDGISRSSDASSGDSGISSGSGIGSGSGPLMIGTFHFNSCNDLRKYLDCRSGCVAQSKGHCDSCTKRCQRLCRNPSCLSGITGNTCGAECNSIDCNKGCQLLSNLSDTVSKPSDPPVHMSLINNQIIFYDAEVPIEIEEYQNPSLLFRIEYSPGQFFYQWILESIMLDLRYSYLIGNSVNVSFAYVTAEHGVSPYSDHETIQFSETCITRNLTESDVEVTYERDTRAGYFLHPVLNISWCPTPCIESVSNYTVTRSGDCGLDPVTTTVDANVSNVILQSSMPNEFDYQCLNITIEVTRTLNYGEELTVEKLVHIPPLRWYNFPRIQTSYTLSYNRTLQQYVLNHRISTSYTPATLSNIDYYRISFHKWFYREDLFSMKVTPNVEQQLTNTTIFLDPSTEDNIYYYIRVEVKWKNNPNYRLPRLLSRTLLTGDLLYIPPPLPISVINITDVDVMRISSDTVQGAIRFNFEKPEILYSNNSLTYQVHFGMLPAQTSDSSSFTILRETSGEVTTIFPNVPSSVEIIPTIFQIRSYQFLDFPSQWSEPIIVDLAILPIPEAPHTEHISLDDLHINQDLLGVVSVMLKGEITWEWDPTNIPECVKLDHYHIEISSSTNPERSIYKPSEKRLQLNSRFNISADYSLDLNISVSAVVGRRRVQQESPPELITKEIRPLPYPRNITVTAEKPRLIRVNGSSSLLSVDVMVEWAHPQYTGPITGYEIYIGTDSVYQAFERLWKSPVMSVSSTPIMEKIEKEISNTEYPKIIVQMRSTQERNIILKNHTSYVPQWSDPVTVSLVVLPPPIIKNTNILSFDLIQENGLFSIDVTVNVSWKEIENRDEVEYYEVWVGSRAFGDFEELQNDDEYGSVFKVEVENTTTSSDVETSTTTDDNSTVTYSIVSRELSSSFVANVTTGGKVYIQIRSINQRGIPKWGMSVSHTPTLPPLNITVQSNTTDWDTGANTVTVSVTLVWDPVSSMSSLLVEGQQMREAMSSYGSGQAGSGSDQVTALNVYMGQAKLHSLDRKQKDKKVFIFEASATGGTLNKNYNVSNNTENLELYIQMMAESEGGFSFWSKPLNLTLSPPSTGLGVNTSSKGSSLQISLAVAASVIFVILIAILAVVFCICYNKRRFKIISKGTENILSLYYRPDGHRETLHDEWEIPADDVIVDELLGEGAFGEVYKGVIRRPLKNSKIPITLRRSAGITVAIKLLKLPSILNDKVDFLAEIDMMKKIAVGYNAHVVNMVGCVTVQEPICLITEFVPYGDLISYLKYQRKKCSHKHTEGKQQSMDNGVVAEQYETMSRPYNGQISAQNEDPKYENIQSSSDHPELKQMNSVSEDNSRYKDLGDLEPDDLIRFAYQIASGMEYLASMNIVHRDLACRNVLVDKDKLLKITDFGLSREVQEVYVKKTSGRLPLKWMAIESITARQFTTASDVWAFGVTLYEIGTIGGFPYPAIENRDLLRLLTEGYRLEKPENCSTEVYDVMLDCWREDPQNRPSFTTLRSTFSDMLLASCPEAYIDLKINEEALYYQIDDLEDEKQERRASRNPTDTMEDIHEQEETTAGSEDGYIHMKSTGSALLGGIPISKLASTSTTLVQ